jgi:hypothetical protein
MLFFIYLSWDFALLKSSIDVNQEKPFPIDFRQSFYRFSSESRKFILQDWMVLKWRHICAKSGPDWDYCWAPVILPK